MYLKYDMVDIMEISLRIHSYLCIAVVIVRVTTILVDFEHAKVYFTASVHCSYFSVADSSPSCFKLFSHFSFDSSYFFSLRSGGTPFIGTGQCYSIAGLS